MLPIIPALLLHADGPPLVVPRRPALVVPPALAMLPFAAATVLQGAAGGGGGGAGGPFTTTGKLGLPGAYGSSAASMGTNQLSLQGFHNRLDAACTFSTYTITFTGTITAGAKFTPCLYSDNGSNAPGTLIASGTEITLSGAEVNSDQTYSFGSTRTLAANTKYWFGFLASADFRPLNAGPASTYNLLEWKAFTGLTYASGPPTNPTSPISSGNVLCVLLNVTLARGAAGYWDEDPHLGSDAFSGAGQADVVKITTPSSGTCSADALALRLAWGITAGGKFKGVIYADSGGAPGALLATGSEVTLTGSNIEQQSTFSAVTLAASTSYWVGIWADSANRIVAGASGTGYGQTKSGGTYASGPFSSMSGSADTGRQFGAYLLFS